MATDSDEHLSCLANTLNEPNVFSLGGFGAIPAGN